MTDNTPAKRPKGRPRTSNALRQRLGIAPAAQPHTMPVPYYVDPRTLQIGAVVSDDEDPNHTRLVVTNIEPALIVADPEGNERVLLAHMATVLEDHPSPYCPCELCRSRLP